MESLHAILDSAGGILGRAQILLDLVILVLLVVLVAYKRDRISKKDAAVLESFRAVVDQTTRISGEFEENLSKRQELIRHISEALDQRIQEAESLCARLSKLEQAAARRIETPPTQMTPPSPRSIKSDQQRVLSLARKGLDAPAIAANLNKPVGEVELILKIQKIAS